MQVIKDNALTKIYYTEDPELQAKVDDYLYMQLAEQVPGAEFSPQVKRGYWDGMVHFYDKKEHTFATGLCDDVVRLLDKVRFVYEFTYEVIDNRPDRFVDVDNLDPHLKTGGLELRDYQQQAVENVFKTNGGIVNLTVSAGKTLVGATIIDQIIPHLQKGERILFFTNNKEIFNQSIDNLNKFLDKPVGYLGAGKKKDAQVMVCMIPTMMSYLKIDPEAGLKFTEKERQVKKIAKTYAPMFMDGDNDYQKFRSYVNLYQPKKKVDEVTKEILEEIRDSVGNDIQLHNALTNYQDKYSKIVNKRAGDLVKKKKYGMDILESAVAFVADESHHAKADTWYQVLLSCSNAIYKVGLTGTIDKDDPVLTTRLKGIFGSVVARVSASELIERDLLARPTIVMLPIKEPHSLASRSTKGPGAWQQIYKEGVVENKYRNTLIAAIVQRQFNAGSTVLVIVNHIAQADIISAYLDELSIPHEFINGQQTSDQRKQELENVKEGANQVLLATAVLDEGVDIANIDTLILAAGGKSTRQVVQRIGRVLRKKKGKENKATIFDFDDQTHKILRGHTKSRLAIYKEQGFEVKYAGK